MPTKVQTKKFRELILYVARETEADPKCGKPKLYKILFYSDFWAYSKLGHSISGQEYQKLKNGPAPRRALPEIKEMLAAHLCAWATRDYQDEQTTIMKGTTFNFVSDSAREVAPDMAVADWDVEVTGMKGPDGAAMPPLKHHVTVVWVKHGGQWWAAAARPVVYQPPPGKPM